MELRLRAREAACLQSDSQGNQLDSTSSKGSPALKSPDCVLSSVGRSLSPSCSMGLVKDRPGRRKRDSSCTSMFMDHFQPLRTEREKTDLLNQVMLGVMGTERYDELKLAQACFVSFQEFMARIKLKRKLVFEQRLVILSKGPLLATLPAKEESLDRAYGRAILVDPRTFIKVRARHSLR